MSNQANIQHNKLMKLDKTMLMCGIPILDTNTEAQSYTHLKVKKPYLALNLETYISLTNQELRSCKKDR